jgi:hypothetical protein
MSHIDKQRSQHDLKFSEGPRAHVTSDNPLVRYVVRWRLREGLGRLHRMASSRLSARSSILVMCAGEGLEGSILCDLGYSDVTVSDLSSVAVTQAQARDNRLKGLTLNAECTGLPTGTFDLVVVQDGLHHLQNPVLGFTEMLRIARVAVIFLEPHDSIPARLMGTRWEKNGDAINYVFRWTRKLVEDVASSYLGPDTFTNHSFSFWHHNVGYHRLGRVLGEGALALHAIRGLKSSLDATLGRFGNQFCGLILKH